MKFWTVQSRAVMETVYQKGVYQPDFSKSRYVSQIPNLEPLYAFLLSAFNGINNTELPGLIFAFAGSDGRQIYPLENIEEFYVFIQSKKNAIESLWRAMGRENSVIVELDCDGAFNPIFIDINDFQFLMPPVTLLPPYTRESIDRICEDIARGQIRASEFPSYVIQAHLPNIRKEQVAGIYSVFALQ